MRKPPSGFIRIQRLGAPAYVRPWFKELSERSKWEFTHGKEASPTMCENNAQVRFAQTTYYHAMPLRMKPKPVELAMAA